MDIEKPLIREGEEIRALVRYTRDQIAQFAQLTGDLNPLHHDRLAAERAGYGTVVASGQQTAAQMMGAAASHFTRSDDGVAREMMCLESAFTFPNPVFAEQEVQIHWRVVGVERQHSRAGFVGRLEGTAAVAGRPCVTARAAVLVRVRATRLT